MKVGKTRLQVLFGDITSTHVDAVVTPANNMLWTGGGISAKIHKAGGKTIEKEALTKAPAEIGTAVVTGGGNLKARWVIHAVICGQDLTTDEQSIGGAARACCAKADEINARSIALPLLDTAGYGMEVHLAARIVVDETIQYLVSENSSLERIVYVEYEETLRDIFKKTLHEKFTKHG